MFRSLQPRGLAPVALLFALGLLVSGCGGRLTPANYDKINTGMTLAEVEEILGKGTKQETVNPHQDPALAGMPPPTGAGNTPQGTETYVWEARDKTITVTFSNGKVQTKNKVGL
jgi:hypothetical protein